MRYVALFVVLALASGCYCSHRADRFIYGDLDAGADAAQPPHDAGPDAVGNDDGGRADDAGVTDAAADAGTDAGCTCGGTLACIDGRCVDAIIRVSAGFTHTCALRYSGGVVCWGRNADGQLGDGSTTDATTPTVAGLAAADAIDVEAGAGVSCAVHTGGSIDCWGTNARGQLGDGMTDGRHVPGAVLGITDSVDVALGSDHACAVRSTGGVVCWGGNDMGETGTGSLGSRRTPGAVVGVSGASLVTAGQVHTCASSSAGQVSCWGSNEDGQLGDPSVITGTSMPRALALPGLIAASGGRAFTCALRDSERVTCWGRNTRGQTGTDTVGTITDAPGADVAGLAGVAQVTAGADFACARLNGGTVQCWGANDRGQLGDGTVSNRFEARPVTGLSDVIWVDAGEAHACAVISDGSVWCWGSNQYGQLGNGRTMETRTMPVRVEGLP